MTKQEAKKLAGRWAVQRNTYPFGDNFPPPGYTCEPGVVIGFAESMLHDGIEHVPSLLIGWPTSDAGGWPIETAFERGGAWPRVLPVGDGVQLRLVRPAQGPRPPAGGGLT